MAETLQYPDFSCVALYKKLIVGFAFLVPDTGFNESYISFLFVRPEWRRGGIATFMLYHLIQVGYITFLKCNFNLIIFCFRLAWVRMWPCTFQLLTRHWFCTRSLVLKWRSLSKIFMKSICQPIRQSADTRYFCVWAGDMANLLNSINEWFHQKYSFFVFFYSIRHSTQYFY